MNSDVVVFEIVLAALTALGVLPILWLSPPPEKKLEPSEPRVQWMADGKPCAPPYPD